MIEYELLKIIGELLVSIILLAFPSPMASTWAQWHLCHL